MRILSVAFGIATLIACNGGTTVPSPGNPTTLEAADLLAGDLVITEFIADALDANCLDSNGEWVEIYNDSGYTVDSAGVRLRDYQGNVTVLPSVIMPAGSYALFGKGPASSWCEAEATPDGFYASSFFINNTGNENLAILTPASAMIDEIPVFVDLGTVQGSIALDARFIGADLNDNGGNWYYSNTCTPSEPLGSPGYSNWICNAP
ncbi:MAG: lamin tail domain-containing protein [Myxococcota bacterium]